MSGITNFLYSFPAMCVWVPLGVLIVFLYVKDYIKKRKSERPEDNTKQ